MPVGLILFRPFARLTTSSKNKAPAFRGLALLVLAALSVACASTPQTRQLTNTPPIDLPPRAELVDVPFFAQQEYHCGPAALAAVISYQGNAVIPDQIAPMVYVPELKGSLQTEIVAAARQFDLLPVVLDRSLESLLREVAAGNPVFVLQNLGLDAYPVWHYEVVIGYDLKKREVVLRSGVNRRVIRSFRTFEMTWARADFWGLAVVPASKVPVTARQQDYLDAVIAMEQIGRIKLANQSYIAAAKRWPKSLVALSGVGNTAYALGKYAKAESAFLDALEVDGEKAEVWNNLAYSLAKQGKQASSIYAIQRALTLDPDNLNFKNSYHELNSW